MFRHFRNVHLPGILPTITKFILLSGSNCPTTLAPDTATGGFGPVWKILPPVVKKKTYCNFVIVV